MRSRLVLFVIILLSMVSGYGCATVVHGTSQQISVATDPCGADCQVDGSAKFTTPCKFELTRKVDHIVALTKDGYEPETVEIKHDISGAVAGNILLGGIIGLGVDAVDGAACKLTPDNIKITMKTTPKPEPALQAEPVALAPDLPKPKSKAEQLEELDQLKTEGKISKKEYKASREKILEGE